MYQNNMKMVLDRYTARYTRRIRRKAETHVKLFDTCKAQGRDTQRTLEDLKDSLDI